MYIYQAAFPFLVIHGAAADNWQPLEKMQQPRQIHHRSSSAATNKQTNPTTLGASAHSANHRGILMSAEKQTPNLSSLKRATPTLENLHKGLARCSGGRMEAEQQV
jgi:hypothetical protein